jgi:hypothetical protein
MNPIQLLANLRRMSPEAQRWLSRDNNGTTDAYTEHLKQFDHPKSDRDPAEILASFDEYHGGAE